MANRWPPEDHQDVQDEVERLRNAPAPVTTIPNYFREYDATTQTWAVRGTENPDHPRTWLKREVATPNPPEGGDYFRVGVDILLAATES